MSNRTNRIRRRTSSPPRRRRAMVLIIVTVVVAMLSLAGLHFVNTMGVESRTMDVRGERICMEHVAASGSEAVRVFLEQSQQARDQAGGTWDNAGWFCDVVVDGGESTGETSSKTATAKATAAGRREGAKCRRFSVVVPAEASGGERGVRFGLENESGKLNLGILLRWEMRSPGAAHRALMNLPGMTDATASAILDWIDPDSTPRPGGAEADYYAEIGAPYSPRNGVPQCLEELLLVRGVTRELLFGREASSAGRSEVRSHFTTESDSAAPWASMLTVSSGERNETYDGKPRVNVNMNDLAALHRQLLAVLDQPLADFVVFYRQYGPYAGPEAPVQTPTAVDFSKPPTHRIAGLLDLVGSKVRCGPPGQPASQHVPIVGSPLKIDSGASQEGLVKLLDVATVVDRPVVFGKININLAPKQVLRAIPGVDAGLAERIATSRALGDAKNDAGRRNPAWLFNSRLVDLAGLKALLPYVTCGGDVYRGRIVGHVDGYPPAIRADFAVDATMRPARQIYWKDLRRPGHGRDMPHLGDDASSGESRAAVGPRRDANRGS